MSPSSLRLAFRLRTSHCRIAELGVNRDRYRPREFLSPTCCETTVWSSWSNRSTPWPRRLAERGAQP